MRTYALVMALWFSLTSALAAQSVGPSPERVLTSVPNADKFFRVQPDGSVTHTLSGLSCPTDLPNLNFVDLKIYVPDGTDVSCQYARTNAETGETDAYVTLYFYRYTNVTTERNFVDAKRSIEVMYPGANHKGATDLPEGLATEWPDIRSAKYDIIMHDRPFLSFLTVLETQGWTVKTRVSTARDVLTTDGMTMHVRDQMMSAYILRRVLGVEATP